MSYTVSTGWKHVPNNPRKMKAYFNWRTAEWKETRDIFFKAMKHLFDNEWLSASKAYREVSKQITNIKVWIKIWWKTIYQKDIPSENRVYDWIKDEKDKFHYFKTKRVQKQIEL